MSGLEIPDKEIISAMLQNLFPFLTLSWTSKRKNPFFCLPLQTKEWLKKILLIDKLLSWILLEHTQVSMCSSRTCFKNYYSRRLWFKPRPRHSLLGEFYDRMGGVRHFLIRILKNIFSNKVAAETWKKTRPLFSNKQ